MQRTNATHAPPPIAVQLSALLFAALTACGPEPDDSVDPEKFRESCEQIMACDCLVDRYADVDTCMREAVALRAGWLAAVAAAGLTPNTECMDQWQAADPDMCLTTEEYYLRHPPSEDDGSTECGVCNIGSGDRQVGDECTEFSWYGRASDCAPGLLCLWIFDASGGVCVDPCVPATDGLPCENTVNLCGEGLHCDVEERVCRPDSGTGEPCEYNSCGPHDVCDQESDRCVRLPGDGEPCFDEYCDWAEGLTCLPTDVCGSPPKLGDPCLVGCADELYCHPVEQVCVPPGRAGDDCGDGRWCVPELHCFDNVCVVGGDLGEPCDDTPCRFGLTCIDDVCGPGQGLLCGDY